MLGGALLVLRPRGRGQDHADAKGKHIVRTFKNLVLVVLRPRGGSRSSAMLAVRNSGSSAAVAEIQGRRAVVSPTRAELEFLGKVMVPGAGGAPSSCRSPGWER